MLHGQGGEDGTVQGALEACGIPYAGCGVLASAVCMDKDVAHRLAAAAGVRSPRCAVLYRGASDAARREALDEKVAVEEAVEGIEVGCAVVGDAVHGIQMGAVDEIVVPGDGFFRIHLEKDPGANTELRCPAELPDEVLEHVRAAGRAVYEALGCSGFARVDLFVTPAGEVVFNEVNSTPGLTSYSRFPQMMRSVGRELGDVLAGLIQAELERGGER